jgi:hypothetical protein
MSDVRPISGARLLSFEEEQPSQNANSHVHPATADLEHDEMIRPTGTVEATVSAPVEFDTPAGQGSYNPNESLGKSVTLVKFKDGSSGTGRTKKGGSTTSAPVAKSSNKKDKIDGYFDKANAEYKLPDGKTVRTPPNFRMNHHDKVNGDSGLFMEGQLNKVLKPQDPASKKAIHMVAYGRGTPEQIRQVTQALIDKGGIAVVKKIWQDKGEKEFKDTFPNTTWPITDADAVKLLQFSMGVGIDCAGYAQQEFLQVHGGSREDYGFQSIGDESLSGLKGNNHFKQVGAADAQPGDIMALDPPANENVGHVVVVQDRHVMTDAERANYPGVDAFAKLADKVQVVVVEGSFGAGAHGDPTRGGVQRRAFLYNENTKQWADMSRDWDKPSLASVHISDANGPYNHPLNGIFHPTGT